MDKKTYLQIVKNNLNGQTWENICDYAFHGCSGAKNKKIFYYGNSENGPCIDKSKKCLEREALESDDTDFNKKTMFNL